MRVAWIGVLVAMTAGCMDEPKVEFGGMDIEELEGAEVEYASDDEFATLTENGAVKLGLTSERVYFEASAALRGYIDREIAQGMEESDSRVGRAIGNAVRRGVQSALDIDIAFRLEEIRDVDYREGELVFDFVDPDDERTLRNIEIDDAPITRGFAEDDARAFVDAFRRVKAGESLRSGAVRSTDTAADRTISPPDTGGGASF